MPQNYLIGILVAIGILAATAFGSFNFGVDYEAGKWAAEKAKNAEALAAAVKARTDAVRAKEDAAAEFQATLSSESQRLKGERDAAQAKYIAAVRAGTQRVFVSAKCPANGDSTLPGTPPNTGQPATTVSVELDGRTVEDVIRYGGRVNDLQANYNDCYETLINDRK